MSGDNPAHKHSCVLAIGAHPDDAVISVGGLLAQLSQAGHQVVILTLSSGELGGNPALREHEEQEAARRLGASVEFGRMCDGEIALRRTVKLIDQVVALYRPAIVLVHSAQDTHQDHITAAEAATIACRYVPTLLCYESPSSRLFQPSITLDVAATWERKLHAIQAHASQLADRQLMAWVDSVARYRAWPRHVGSVCEALQVCHAEALPLVGGMLRAQSAAMGRLGPAKQTTGKTAKSDHLFTADHAT